MNALQRLLSRAMVARTASPRIVPRIASRSLSTSSFDGSESFVPSPPDKLTTDMAEGIADATQFFLRYGLSHRRLVELSHNDDLPVVTKWQKMMEVFLSTQIHVTTGMGYAPDEHGLTLYAQHLAECISNSDPTMQQLFQESRRDTWRDMVSIVFQVPIDEIPTLTIVEARSLMHTISSKMLDPAVLEMVRKEASTVVESDKKLELVRKHNILQNIIVNNIYLSGDPSFVEQAGFGSGAQGYAKMQCALSDFEGDPLIAQYAGSSMQKLMEAAGLDAAALQGVGVS